MSDLAKTINARNALVDTLDAIANGSTEATSLQQALLDYRETTPPGAEGDMPWAYCELIEALIHAVRWINAQWNAQPEASRHATAARLRASAVVDRSHPTWPDPLMTAARYLAELAELSTPRLVAAILRRVPIPPRVTPVFKPTQQTSGDQTGDDPPEETPNLAIVIRFQGEPVMRPTALQPGAMHQFEAEIRTDRWPEEADQLEVKFISVFSRELSLRFRLELYQRRASAAPGNTNRRRKTTARPTVGANGKCYLPTRRPTNPSPNRW